MSFTRFIQFFLMFMLGVFVARLLVEAPSSQQNLIVDFSNATVPINVVGLSAPEPWGRWTVSPKIVLSFERALPRKFDLLIVADASSSLLNVGFEVKAGTQSHKLMANSSQAQSWKVSFVNVENETAIRLELPQVKSPRELGISADERRLGLGLRLLAIIPK